MNKDYILHNGELYHWGVLGMKWGRRKAKYDYDQPDTRSDDQKRYDSLKTKRLSEMSNAELRAYMDRLNLERNYQAANPDQKERARRFVKTVVSDAKTAYDAYTTVNNIVKLFDDKDGLIQKVAKKMKKKK